MADKIRINTDRLSADAGRIQNCIENIEKVMAELKQSVSAMENMWEGPAKSAFHKAFQDDMAAADAAVSDLKSIHSYDTNAEKQYEQCEKKIASMIADIRL